MNYRLIIRPEAELDLEDAFTWYESQDSGLGSEFVRAIDACISTIGRNPLAYRLIYQQARRALVRRFPYCLFYIKAKKGEQCPPYSINVLINLLE